MKVRFELKCVRSIDNLLVLYFSDDNDVRLRCEVLPSNHVELLQDKENISKGFSEKDRNIIMQKAVEICEQRFTPYRTCDTCALRYDCYTNNVKIRLSDYSNSHFGNGDIEPCAKL